MPEEVAPGVWVERGFRGANVGAIITAEGIILIDTPMIPEQALSWKDFLTEVSGGKPFLYVINTDHHRGHVLGNQRFGCPVIAHYLAWKTMRGYRDNFKQRVLQMFKRQPAVQAQLQDLRIILPEITFEDRLAVVKGGRQVEVIWVGGHTPATSIVHLPQERVVFAGDIITEGEHPFMSQANSTEWLKALDLIRSLQPEKVVPGHGQVSGPEVIEPLERYLHHMRALVEEQLDAGKTKTETANALAPELLTWFPIPSHRRPKITQQIKQGVGKVYLEMQRFREQAARQEQGQVEALEKAAS